MVNGNETDWIDLLMILIGVVCLLRHRVAAGWETAAGRCGI